MGNEESNRLPQPQRKLLSKIPALLGLILLCPDMILQRFSILTLSKLQHGLCWPLSEDLESLKGLLLTEFSEHLFC